MYTKLLDNSFSLFLCLSEPSSYTPIFISYLHFTRLYNKLIYKKHLNSYFHIAVVCSLSGLVSSYLMTFPANFILQSSITNLCETNLSAICFEFIFLSLTFGLIGEVKIKNRSFFYYYRLSCHLV